MYSIRFVHSRQECVCVAVCVCEENVDIRKNLIDLVKQYTCRTLGSGGWRCVGELRAGGRGGMVECFAGSVQIDVEGSRRKVEEVVDCSVAGEEAKVEDVVAVGASLFGRLVKLFSVGRICGLYPWRSCSNMHLVQCCMANYS